LFECVRCMRKVENEEAHLIYSRKYCRACEIFLTNDPESVKLLAFLSRYYDVEAMI